MIDTRDDAADGAADDLTFYARQFTRKWYRGEAHLENDLRRFSATYRVPAPLRQSVGERVAALLAGGAPAERRPA